MCVGGVSYYCSVFHGGRGLIGDGTSVLPTDGFLALGDNVCVCVCVCVCGGGGGGRIVSGLIQS